MQMDFKFYVMLFRFLPFFVKVRLTIAHWIIPDTPTKRQATQHGYLPSFLGDGDKAIEIVYGEEKKYFVLD
jgi:hypothetical protein